MDVQHLLDSVKRYRLSRGASKEIRVKQQGAYRHHWRTARRKLSIEHNRKIASAITIQERKRNALNDLLSRFAAPSLSDVRLLAFQSPIRSLYTVSRVARI